uniref:Palmdelphin n=2 Tax=Oryzias melastigma TaxID=30732 RepID=A0A3B3BV44_ORYME
MEEAELLKERLQAITDKRRIQEDIAKKRRRIEEEKLKLQYIKKKALREQWLMDGLSQQSEEELEAMRLQAEGEQQQSDELQQNILRIEKEIEVLEMQELSISANEEVVLKRLKEVERTAEEIIRDLNTELHTAGMYHPSTQLPDKLPLIPAAQVNALPKSEPSKETKTATFAIEISVEHDQQTGRSHVVSTATINPNSIQERGLKVFDDGRKSVFALRSDGGKVNRDPVGQMTTTQVEELLLQAAEQKLPTEVQYHQPVFSAPYTGTGKPTRGTQTQRRRDGCQVFEEETPCIQPLQEQRAPSKIPQHPPARVQMSGHESELPLSDITKHSTFNGNWISNPNCDDTIPEGPTFMKTRASATESVPVCVTVQSEGAPVHSQPESTPSDPSPFRNHQPVSVNTGSEEHQSESITMIFMGYENADEHEDNVQAEIVIIGHSDDEDNEENVEKEPQTEECVSYHPEGHRSKIYQPKVGKAKIGPVISTDTSWDDLELHKPTFIHRPGKRSPHSQGQEGEESGGPSTTTWRR